MRQRTTYAATLLLLVFLIPLATAHAGHSHGNNSDTADQTTESTAAAMPYDVPDTATTILIGGYLLVVFVTTVAALYLHFTNKDDGEDVTHADVES